MLLWPLAMLFLTMPEVTVSDDAVCRPPPREFLNDTNVYVCPPAVSGEVERDILGPTYTKFQGDVRYGTNDHTGYHVSHGYVSFDLAGFPNSARCISARLLYYQYLHSGFWGNPNSIPSTTVVLTPDVNAAAQQLFDDISNGPVVDPTMTTPDGWVVRPFNSAGFAAVDSCILADDSIDIGIKSDWWGAAYGVGPYHPLRAYLEIQYSTTASYCDVVAFDAASSSFPLMVGDSTVVGGRLTNTGNQTVYSLPLIASCTGTSSDTFVIDSLAPDDTIDVCTALPPFAAPGTASLVLCSDVQGDWCRHNDTSVSTTYIFPQGTKSAECFELGMTPSFPPRDWVVYNGVDTATWYRAGPGDRYAHSGEYYATCRGSEDWLITYGLLPEIGVADTIGFFLAIPSGGGAQAWALASQDPYDPIGLLLDTVLPASGWQEVHIGLDQYDGRSVYVGFRTFGTGRASLDDVWFTSERLASVKEPVGVQTIGPRLAVRQNPVTGDQVIIRYQIPNSEPLQVEVTDALGRTIARQRLPITPPCGEVRFATDGWPAGAYFFRLKAGTSSATAKCVMQRGQQ
jgi:hypothetical protein